MKLIRRWLERRRRARQPLPHKRITQCDMIGCKGPWL